MKKLLIYLPLAIITLLSSTNQTDARIGDVTEITGIVQVTRASKDNGLNLKDSIESMDTISTRESKIRIDFIDKTHVKITEHSDLIIDEYVFDPARDLAKLSLKVASGTVQYASGLLAKKVGAVDVKTPTASIAVRGTEFSMSVDELGKSLVILLPNLDGSVGEITVSTDVGSVTLNRSYQSTIVVSNTSSPSPPLLVNLTNRAINNDLLLVPVKPVEVIVNIDSRDDPLNFDLVLVESNPLDKDLLKFDALDIDELKSDLLSNMLGSSDAIFDSSNAVDGQVPGFNTNTQIYTIVEEMITIVQRLNLSTFYVKANKDLGLRIQFSGDGLSTNFTMGNENTQNILRINQK